MKTFLDCLFQHALTIGPTRIALSFRGQPLTYAELDARSNRLANRLRKLGVGPDVLVGLYVERGVEAVVGILSVLKAGGAYVPLDVEYPSSRLEFILADTGITLALTSRALREQLGAAAMRDIVSICLDEDWPQICDEPATSPPELAKDEHLAYVIYTSGSTGQPKGVLIERGGLRNIILAQRQVFGLNPDDRVLQFSSLCFDASVFEICMAFGVGATLVVAPPEMRIPGTPLLGLMRDEAISCATLPPSVLAAIPSEHMPHLTTITVAGEACDVDLVRRFAPGRRFFNLYGPTETTIWATYSECLPSGGKPSIGKAINGIHVVLLDDKSHPVASGESGEICIGGAGLARGYLNRPELTNKHFVTDPTQPGGDAGLYRSGDIGRLMPDGTIEYIGRKDDQVKIRGFRIELGEVEVALRSYIGIRDAVVTVREMAGHPQLVAYVVPKAFDGEIQAAGKNLVPALRDHLQQRLPAQMLPAAYVVVKALPLTLQGKVDRRALPAPTADRSQLSTSLALPSTALEIELVELWEEVLKRSPIGIHDNFFELGGDSLVGAMLVNAVQRKLDIQLYIVALFDAPTVAEQAEYLQAHFPEACKSATLCRELLPSGPARDIGTEDFARFSKAAASWHGHRSLGLKGPKVPRVAFILCPPRSGSSLLRIVLAGHRGLFAPPELELLNFATMGERGSQLKGRLGFMAQGLHRAIMELRGCDTAEAETIVGASEADDESVEAFYCRLQGWIGDRLLVDKSTTYALSPVALARAEEIFEDAIYIHLLRHPYGTIRSFEEARLDRVLTFEGIEDYSLQQYSELIWSVSHRNILEFLAAVPSQRQLQIRFEDLVEHPETVVRTLCEALGVAFEPIMLDPYQDRGRRMTDGVNSLGGMSDPKFDTHSAINPAVARRWREGFSQDYLSEATWQLAEGFGYSRTELPATETPSIAASDGPSPEVRLPLQSYAQQRLWILDQLDPGNPGYNTHRVMQLEGLLHESALQNALDEIVRRHEVCRTSFGLRDSLPVQLVGEAANWPLRRCDLLHASPAERQYEVDRLVQEEVLAPFDLADHAPCRGLLIRLGEAAHVLVLSIHHIVSDAWSRAVLHRELSSLYAAFMEGAPSPLSPLSLQYADYALRQRKEMEGPRGDKLRHYWLTQMQGAPARVNLPQDRPRPPRQTHRGSSRQIILPDATFRDIKALGQSEGATPFMVFCLAYFLLLGQSSDQRDLVVGIPVSGRSRSEYEGLIGQFINVLPIRVHWTPAESFRQLLGQIRETCLGALAHQDYPFDLLVSSLKIERVLDHHPLFQVMFAWEQPRLQDLDLAGLVSTPIELLIKPMPYDLILSIQQTGDVHQAVFDYNLDLFAAERIDRLATAFVELLQRIVDSPERPLGEGVQINRQDEQVSDSDAQMTSPVTDEAAQKRERLKQLILRQAAGQAGQPERTIEIQRRDVPQPLSFAQEELWLLGRIDPGSVAFNIGVPPLRFEGFLNSTALEQALRDIVERHTTLRTVFAQHQGKPVQCIRETDFLLKREDLSGVPADQRESTLFGFIDREYVNPFDLEHGPLLRATLVKLGDESHVLLLVVHHIIFDANSVGRLFFELAKLYGKHNGAGAEDLPALPVQYADFAAWQRHVSQAGAMDKQLAYWLDRLQGLAEPRLPTDYPRRAHPTFRAVSEYLILPPALSDALRALSRKENVTLFHTTLAAFMVLLHRYSGETDIVIGSPVTTRHGKELEGLIGFFVNMMLLRGDLSGQPTFHEMLAQVRDLALSGLQNSDVPFDTLFRRLRSQQGMSRNMLFQATFAFEGTQTRSLEFPGLAASIMPFHTKVTRFDLETYVRDEAEGLRVVFIGASDLFEPATVWRMLNHYKTLLAAIVADPGRQIDHYPLMPSAERDAMLSKWNDTVRDYPRDACVHELFAEQARRQPDAIALQYGDETLNYGELDARADHVAAYLRSHGVGPEVPVGLAMVRGIASIVGMLGILKAGGAYLPLDPEYPAERLEFMLRDTGAPIVISHSSLVSSLPAGLSRLVCIDTDWPEIASCPMTTVSGQVNAQNLAYVIYTSGSTGTPKGVAVPHRGIVRLVRNTDYVQATPDDCFAQVSVMSFDAATFEIWGALLNGARVVGVPREISLSPVEFAAYLGERGITTLFLTTALFNQMARLVPNCFASLRYVLFGGEASDPETVRSVLHNGPPANLLHVYGPTEVTTYATWYRVSDVPPGVPTIPIGRPIANTTAYVLDATLEPVPAGVPGELYLGGDGLARGYLNRPDLTQKSFVPHPFVNGERLYRTGDWVRYLGDGNIAFIGRRDGQVKVRGFRIELGEIEAALSRLPQVRDTVVMVREDAPGDKRVVAYVVSSDGSAASLGDLRATLKHVMPDYMMPSAFVQLAQLPLTPNGKVNRSALPIPVVERPVEAAPVQPRSKLEAIIAGIWCEMLGLAQVGTQDNFFDLGGHSLLLVQTHGRLCEVLQCQDRLKVVDLFEHPTVEALARHLETNTKPAGQAISYEPVARPSQGPIGIVGMAGRFPEAQDVETFWTNLRAGRESVQFFSEAEMRAAGVPDVVLRDPNYVGARGYLADADKFDANYFGYSAREAELMDPQHRLLLECAQEALDSGGYDPDRFPGAIGVYAGASSNTYLAHFQSGQHAPASMGGLSKVLASSPDFLTTRISYKLNLRGPSLNIQTACSTSLVAVHHACRALQEGDCDMALAGGVSVTVPTKTGHMYVEEGIGSRDGHCRAFDAAASGTVGGNGVAMVLLKRLEDALRDGDNIHAVIRGTGINNDGAAKVGFTAPSIEGQAAAITRALSAAGCEPNSIGYLEAHGTGTLLGDPIEVAALTRVYGRGKREQPCAIGALKSNVGHLDAAAGVAGLIKATLCVEHGELVPSLNFNRPNPQIDFDAAGLVVNTALTSWQPSECQRRAGISSFGLGGTNAHVIVEQAPVRESSVPGPAWQLLCLSAKSTSSLDRGAKRLADFLAANTETNMADVAYTLQVGRRELGHRRFVVCDSTSDAAAALGGAFPERVVNGQLKEGCNPDVVFMFSGQGTQYPDMGRGLYRSQALFHSIVDDACERLQPRLGLDLRTLLFPEESERNAASEQLRRTELTQPALFVIEYAMARLWMSWGIRPAAMIGHSIGEYVAACIAEVMSFEDALDLVAERGRLMGALPGGVMLALQMTEADLRPLLADDQSLASVNGPSLCVVAGTDAAISRLEAKLAPQQLSLGRLHTSHAFHSHMVEPVLEEFRRYVARLHLKEPTIPYLSNVSGDWISPAEATDPAYYASHLRHTVQFSLGVEKLLAERVRVFLELGPGHTLGSLAKRYPTANASHSFVSSLRHPQDNRDDEAVLNEGLGRLWLAGVRADWTAVHAVPRRRLRLPSYAFERTRFWLDAKPEVAVANSLRRIADPARWIWVPAWRRAPVNRPHTEKYNVSWLLFDDGFGVAEQLASELADRGARVVRVLQGNRFEVVSKDVFRIAPTVAADYKELLAKLAEGDALPDYAAHLWLLDAASATRNETNVEDRGFYSVLNLLQALAEHPSERCKGLAVVASYSREVIGGEPVHPEKALVEGLCLNVGMEFPQLRARFIDAEPSGPARLAGALAADLCAPWQDSITAYRNGYRWALDYAQQELPVPSAQPRLLRNNGVYLITGGLGGLGLELADYLVQRTRGKLALVGRTLLPPREEWSNWLRVHDAIDITSIRMRRILNLEAAGAELLLLQADVADATQMTAVIRAIEAEFGPIAGVVHAAGAEKSAAPLAGLTRIDCEKQFTSRTQGLRVLAEVLQERQLDFCLVNSSLASTMGVMGFAAYTAAHLSMDAFVASIAQSFDYPWLTVNWDNWNLQGGPAMTEYYMNPADAKQVLDRILDIGASPQTIVSSGDLRARVAQWVKAESVATDAADFKNVDTFAADGHPRPELSTPYIEPNNNVERTLAAIWRDMLGIDRVGVHDNFFELGGDSVLNIQITARANKAGLKLTPKQVFEHQTIAALAAVAGAAGTEKTVNAEPVTGPVPLTPIQHWFFERTPAAASHFNLPLLLQTRRALNPSVLAEAIARVERHHDALRMRYARTDNGWSQEIVAPGSTSPVTQINLIGQTREEQVRAIEEHGTKLQTSLDISTGPVLCAALFDLGANQSGRLLLVAHHLMMDMIGWRIFLEDLQMAYQSLDGGHEPAFPAKTTSIKTWSMRLGQYANSTTAESELEAWCALGKESQRRLPLDFASGDNSVASSDRVVVELDPEETRALLTDLPRLCQSQIQDALLLGVVEALSEWIGSEALWVDLEGHGREAMLDDVDVSRTIGWFTTIAPLALPLPRSLALTERLQFVHQRLQAMPNHGMGFGILRYLNQHVGIKERLAALPLPEISFLYMGQFDQAFAGDSWFAPAPESAGPPHDPSGQRHHLLSINSIVSQGRLHVSWTYGRHLHRKETILRLANAHLAALRAMLAKSTAAPSLPGKQFSTDVSAADLAEIARQIQLATGTET